MPEHRFDNRVAIVTGAGRGLGAGHALLLAARGAHVVVNDLGAEMDGTRHSSAPADAVVAEITSAGGRALANYSDISTVDGSRELLEFALESFGRVDIVVNNAGILRDSNVAELSSADWFKVIDVNLSGPFWVTQHAWPVMTAQGYGRIVNVSSAAGLYGNAGQVNYAAAKMGIIGLTQTLALEGAPHGILVNAIVPIGLSRMFRLPDATGIRNETISAAAAWLAHENCSVNGETFWVRRDRLAQAVIGLTSGLHDPAMTIESIFSNLDKITDTAEVNFPGLGGRGLCQQEAKGCHERLPRVP
jgi:NAD(P)-dependent dehydrogenase (short-subunit alcohol dehydrogenase family)